MPAKTQPKEPPAPKRAMSIHAHPDDQEFTVGGTLAKWARAGCEVVTVCITSGGAGSNKYTPLDMTRHALVALREDEQREACQLLGVKETIFLRYEDGMLEPSIALRKDLTRLIRRFRPEVVLTGDPTVRFYGSTYMNHPDHRVAAVAGGHSGRAEFHAAGRVVISRQGMPPRPRSGSAARPWCPRRARRPRPSPQRGRRTRP